MSSAPGHPAVVGVHRLTAEIASPGDRSLPLRVVSLTHRRAVLVLALHWELPDEGDAPSRGRLTMVFRSSEQAARLVHAGVESMIGLVGPVLDLDAAVSA